MVCLTETWLSPHNAFSVPGFTIYRQDRPTSTHATRSYGGVAILIKNGTFPLVRVRTDLNHPSIEGLWMECKHSSGLTQPLLLSCIYRPPSKSARDVDHFVDILSDTLQSANLSRCTLVLTGDFNAHCRDWYAQDTSTREGVSLSRLFTCFGLTQTVAFPTHYAPSGTSSCLDLLVTNAPARLSALRSGCPLGSSDHLPIICDLASPTIEQSPPPATLSNSESSAPFPYVFNRVPVETWCCINDALASVDWRMLFPQGNVDLALERFMCVLRDVFKEHLRQYRFSTGSRKPTPSSNPYPPWVTPQLRRAIKRKHDLYSLSVRFPTPANITNYRRQRNHVKSLSRSSHRSYVQSVRTTMTNTDQPNLYQFVRTLKRDPQSSSIPDLNAQGRDPASDNASKARMLNEQFASVAVPDDAALHLPPTSRSQHLHNSLSSLYTTCAQVRLAIKLLKNKKAPGLDGLTNEVLKALSPSIAYPLCLLFNMSFTTGTFPTVWKTAKIVPVFKNKGSRSSPENYRPISLLSCLSKLCERIYFNALSKHISPALTPVQSGFRRGDSTSLQLTRLVQDIQSHRDQKQRVALCFFDLAKAFDTVWHRALLYKCQSIFAIHGTALSWLASYLTARHQLVSVDGVLSDGLPVRSGVPQGSILGPLLFLIYINDLGDAVPGVSLFADDTALLCAAPTNLALSHRLQGGINDVYAWMQRWRLQPNVGKTEILFISPGPSDPPPYPFTFPGKSDPIAIVQSHKHLGVIIDSKLTWKQHIDHICKRSSAAIGCINSHFPHLPHPCKLLFYAVFVRPIFEYCSTAWSGLSTPLADLLEVHHRRVLKILFRKPSRFSSAALYALTQSQPLEHRRNHALGVLVHRIKLGLVPAHLEIYNWFAPSRTRNQLCLPLASTVLLRSPIFLAYTSWLKLPLCCRTASTISGFKTNFAKSCA